MSMLAEPKRKVKWSLNPCGNLWAKDASKYGQKILEKMGWQKGKGLGKFEDGCTDHIKVAFKQGNSGVGWDGSKAAEFVPFQGDFDSLLKNLKNTHNKFSNTQFKEQVSLETKSKSSRKRVHYQKFVRGKDVSQYSLEDKQSVLGKKKDETAEISCGLQSAFSGAGHENSQNDCSTNDSCIQTYTSATNMSDYFANMAKRRKLNNSGANGYGKHVDAIQDDVADALVENYSYREELFSNETVNVSFSSPIVAVDAKALRRKRKKQKRKKHKRQMLEAEISMNSDGESICNDQDSPLKDCNGEIEGAGEIERLNEICEEDSELKDKSCYDSSCKPPGLRSCLKSNTSIKSVKSVTFNSDISYEYIPSRSECEQMEQDDDDDVNEDAESLSTDDSVSSDESSVQNETDAVASNKNDDSCVSEVPSNIKAEKLSSQGELKDNSPSSISSIQTYMTLPVYGGRQNSDSWSVTLKMAEKMSHYNKIMENISKHEILCTTNLLEIKGYGN